MHAQPFAVIIVAIIMSDITAHTFSTMMNVFLSTHDFLTIYLASWEFLLFRRRVHMTAIQRSFFSFFAFVLTGEVGEGRGTITRI